MKKAVLLFCFSLFIFHFSLSQNPLVKQWDYRFGGDDWDWLTALQQTKDGGYILAGSSWSRINGDKTQALKGYIDYWIVKIDSVGNRQWDKDLGSDDLDALSSIQQTKDGGYILGGYSLSGIGGDKTQATKGGADYWVVKTTSFGIKEWDKDFGGADIDVLSALQQTADGGYILGGYSASGFGRDKTQPSKGSIDYWIIKLDSLGNKQWDKDFGGLNDDYLFSLQQTNDKGYILGGLSFSGIGGDKMQATKGDADYWIIKIDSLGNKMWDKDFGGADADYLYSLHQTADGGYILGGYSSSGIGGDKTQASKGWEDYWIIKIDSLGNKKWDKGFGGSNPEKYFGNISQTIDGGYLIAGTSSSPISGDKTENNLGGEQTWVVKTDSLGNKQWDKTLFTLGNNKTNLAIQTRDGCYVFANSDDGGIGGYRTQRTRGDYDYWIIKFCDTTTVALPVANFISSDTAFCNEAGKCIDFTDKSTNSPTSWKWLFPGAIPDTSTQQNPANICYLIPGTYEVTLIVSNASGSDTITKSPAITFCYTPPVPVITWHIDTLCAGAECGYQWYKDGTPIPGETNQCYVPTSCGVYTVQIITCCGCVILSSPYSYPCVGINEVGVSRGQFEIHPNPATDVLWIDGMGQNASVTIYNIFGENLLFSPLFSKGVEGRAINIKSFSAGMYFIRVSNERGSFVARFIKE